MSRSSDQRNALSVLPDPVGATTSALRPAATADQAPTCAGVGAANAARNHSRVATPKCSQTASSGSVLPDTPAILPGATDNLAGRGTRLGIHLLCHPGRRATHRAVGAARGRAGERVLPPLGEHPGAD